MIDRIASHRSRASDSTDVTRRRPTTDEKDDDARGRSSGDATRDDERDGGGGATDECGVAKVLRGTCDDYDDDER